MAERDPLASFHYKIDVGGVIRGYFTECNGLGAETEVIEHKTLIGNQDIIQMIPGRTKWEQLKLKRGITDRMDFWAWRTQVETGTVMAARMNGSISMLNQQGDEVARWNFVNAWPTKVSGPELKADSNAYGVEELTIVHEGIWRVK